jgi:hypothetical protein
MRRLVETPEGWLFFHWLGDVYGQALLDLLRPHLAVNESEQPGLALLLREAPRTLPVINSRASYALSSRARACL